MLLQKHDSASATSNNIALLATEDIGDDQVTNDKIESVAWSKVSGKPSTFPPSAHAGSHLGDGSDAIAWTTVHGSGVLSARPAAATANAGYLYLATDVDGGTLYRSTGSAWVQVSTGVSFATVHPAVVMSSTVLGHAKIDDVQVKLNVSNQLYTPDDTSLQKTRWVQGGLTIADRRSLNGIGGGIITVALADNTGSNRVDMTVSTNPNTEFVHGNIRVDGIQGQKYLRLAARTVTGNTTITLDDCMIDVDTSSTPPVGGFNMTLPASNTVQPASGIVRFILWITDVGGLANGIGRGITITAAGTDTINGVASKMVLTAYSRAMLTTNGSGKWFMSIELGA